MSARNAKTRASVTGEYQRLELIRRLLEQTPEKAYTLNELARRAAMSPRACGASFAMPMGVPCLIICAIAAARARRYLMEGYSVQQAASDVRLSTCH